MRVPSIVRSAVGVVVVVSLTACPPRRTEAEVIIPATTVVADAPTLATLSAFDLTSGSLRFADRTALLDKLEVGSVLVAPPSDAAPYGFLRRVTDITTDGGEVVVETVQALLTEAISQGTLDVHGELKPAQLVSMTGAVPGVESRVIEQATPGSFGAQALGDIVSEGYDYEVSFDIELAFAGEDGGASGEGSVRAKGLVRFKAGFDVGMGIEACFEVPPVCMDRFEARAGIEQYVELDVEADIAGRILEEKVIQTFYFKPLVFFIGPVPIVIVPSIDIVVGARGEANATFRYRAVESAQAVVGAKWTDPDDNGVGWQDLSKNNGLQLHGESPYFDSSMQVRAYGRADAALLLYDVVGPEMSVWLGAGADVQVPRRPLWRLFGHFGVRVGFKLDLLGLVRANGFQSTLFELEPVFLEAGNSAPRFSNVKSDTITADIGVPVVLGPRAGFVGYFDVMDPEGDPLTLTAASSLDGAIPLTATFTTTGTRSVTVTARDDQGASATTVLSVKVSNSLPLITVVPGPGTAAATTQYFLSASAYDPETGEMACSSIRWFITAPDTIERVTSGGSCGAVAVFVVQGTRTVRVEATDPHGGTASSTVSVTVTAPPPNLPPVIDTSSFRVLASKGPKTPACPPGTPCGVPACVTGFWCVVPENATLYNGAEGDYHPPLELQATATDPEGDPVTVVWRCTASTGEQFTVTSNGDGTFGCSPGWTGGTYGNHVYMSVYATDGHGQSAPMTRTMFAAARLR